ncbi:uncharacterized protein TNCV_2011641 [Trichonephila clavipes]|nr:uncharacterized protein TNCV_2011641 [Trichonephila clavipes]
MYSRTIIPRKTSCRLPGSYPYNALRRQYSHQKRTGIQRDTRNWTPVVRDSLCKTAIERLSGNSSSRHSRKVMSKLRSRCPPMSISFSSTTYGKCARRLDNAYTLASENIFAEIHREIKNVYENGAEITDLSVSFDGTWLTRGHTSLIGVGCVIDMLTGYVVDFEVMSKVCRHCSVAKNKLGQSSAEFSIWYEGHKSECDINHLGSSTSMEMEAALTLWKRSTSLGFRYITVLSDGGCKTFNYLCEKKVYGPDIVIKKEECINHVSKRLGTALRSTVKDCRAQGISLGGKAHGSLKEATIKN